jgi:diguanylate cyclase (GGDEF)-like protein
VIRERNEASETQGAAVPPDRANWTRDGHRARTHYVAYWSEAELTILCGHQHNNVAEAVACIQSADGSVKAFSDGQERPLTNEEKEGMVRALLQLYGRAKRFSREDPLTGALIRRGFMEVLERESTRSRRCMLPLTLVSVNLDDFKILNNTLGRSTVDLVLKIMGWTMQRSLREVDSVARLGGDRFVMLLPETDADNVRVVLAKLREALKGALETYRWDVTFSTVAVTFQSLPTTDKMIEIAERHMYLLKQRGNDGVSYLTCHKREDNQARSA